MTTEEFLKQLDSKPGSCWTQSDESICEALRKFAQYHVEKALEAASESVCTKHEEGSIMNPEGDWVIDKQSILNAYPLDNIK